MKKKKLLTNFALSCAVLLSLSSSVSAVSTTTVLTPDLTNSWSNVIGLTSKIYYEASNDSTSKHQVYVRVKKVAPGKSWVTAGESLLGKGVPMGPATFIDGNAVSWQMELNPYGSGASGCYATGKLWF